MKLQEKVREFKRMQPKALAQLILEKQERLRQLKFDLPGGKVKNVREIREIKRDLARLFTFTAQVGKK